MEKKLSNYLNAFYQRFSSQLVPSKEINKSHNHSINSVQILQILPMFYYCIAIIGVIGIVLVMYKVVTDKCANANTNTNLPPPQALVVSVESMPQSRNSEMPNKIKSASRKFMYYDEEGAKEDFDSDGGYRCAICLSVCKQGEEVRQLQGCKHIFHAPCIEMWLKSHSDCPLCRTSVEVSAGKSQRERRSGEDSTATSV